MILFASSMVSVSSGRLFLIVPGEAAARHASGVAGAYQLIVIADLLLDEHMFKGGHPSPEFLQFCSAAGFPRMSGRFLSGPHLARLPGCLLECRHETPPFLRSSMMSKTKCTDSTDCMQGVSHCVDTSRT